MRLGGSLAAGLGLAGLFIAAPTLSAGAATGYPPPTIPSGACSVSSTIVLAQSGTTTVPVTEIGQFAPGTTINIIFKGQTVATTVSPTDGSLTISVSAKDPNNPQISIDNTQFQPTNLGLNTITASGLDANSAATVCSFLISIDPAPSLASAPLAFTGADLGALIAGAVILLLLGSAVVVFTRRKAAGQSH
jgi:hypothetical protein